MVRLLAHIAHIALLAALVMPVPAAAVEYAGRIVGVIDGDTVDLLTSAKTLYRIRLSGIDAPEKGQPFGQVAKQALSNLVFNRQVVVAGEKKDRYGRLVGKVLVAGLDANLQMVRRGLAWHFKKYEQEQSPEDRQRYSDAERDARAAHRGLWSDARPAAPWDFRAQRHRE
jgi:endonuclease YncB( thermonuclease family)